MFACLVFYRLETMICVWYNLYHRKLMFKVVIPDFAKQETMKYNSEAKLLQQEYYLQLRKCYIVVWPLLKIR